MVSIAPATRLAEGLRLDTDILVIGGGPAGAWAALAAAEEGYRVILVDKGYFGTSGATAPSNTGTWCVPPGEGRRAAVDKRWRKTGGLADQRWMLRCVDTSFNRLLALAEWGYPFPRLADGSLYLANLRGPDYMRFMRRRVLRAGVTVLDHHPALELLSDGYTVVGAAGVDRQRHQAWQIRARGIVLATGGCAFFERILGATGLTGDGYLMAAEAGAALSGMEFTGKYTLAPLGTSLNKGLPFRWASFTRADGSPVTDRSGEPLVNGIGERDADLARALIEGPVYARFDQADEELEGHLRGGQPNCFLPYDRTRIDPFRRAFQVTLRAEGTVRGTGGIAITDDECGCGVPGLYVAGDAASREAMTGAVSGGGAVNASWAIASGWWAGRGAAAHARRQAGRSLPERVAPLGQAGLRPAVAALTCIDRRELAGAIRDEVIPLERNFFRHGAVLARSGERLDRVWRDVRDHLGAGAQSPDIVRDREVAAVAATARWSVAAALERRESRGVHRRVDHPQTDPAQTRRLLVQGIEDIRVEPQAVLLSEVAS